ncbi:MAG: type II toxin-antitoxin system prevent-host-death family antitoxin [Polyangiaceae bacterium]
MTKTIGVRELRQRASEVLRQVAQGATFEVTDRGRPVALLVPLPEASPLQRLRDSGDVALGRGRLADLAPPPELPRGSESPSQVLARLRRDER